MNFDLKLFDTHTHYDDEAYDGNRNELINAMFGNNVAGFIAVGCSLKRSKQAIELAEQYENCYCTVGIHPEGAIGLPADYLETLEKLARNPKVKAIGEIGLDYYYEGYDKKRQEQVFTEQLELADKLDLPVVIHSRDATHDTLEILRKYKPKAVMHCFSGSAETAEKLVKLGILISFTGVITFKNAKKAVLACKKVPLEMFMLETDCPYLAPMPFRGKRCDSQMAWYTAQRIAQLKKRTTDEVVSICNKNAEKFFGIKIK